MNQDILQGKWKEIKGEIQKTWGDMTSDELEQSKGNLTSISGLIQQKYGYKKEEVSTKLDSILARFGDKVADVKSSAVKMTETIKTDLKK